jgi:hypothetical protein
MRRQRIAGSIRACPGQKSSAKLAEAQAHMPAVGPLNRFCKEFRVASNTSKTARASVRAGQAGAGGALSVLGEFKYLIPLDGGKHAYVRNLTNGKTTRLRTDSEAFIEEIRMLAAAGHGPKIRAEFSALAAASPAHGWDATEKRLIAAGVFGDRA